MSDDIDRARKMKQLAIFDTLATREVALLSMVVKDQYYDIGDITETDFAINYFGGYLGVGWEFDLFNGAITTGPEIFGFAGFGDRDNAEAYTATIAWHFLVNF